MARAPVGFSGRGVSRGAPPGSRQMPQLQLRIRNQLGPSLPTVPSRGLIAPRELIPPPQPVPKTRMTPDERQKMMEDERAMLLDWAREAAGVGRAAWALIPQKRRGAILGAALFAARRHPVVAGASLGIAAIQAGRAAGVPERVAESGVTARRRLLPETLVPVTVTGPQLQSPPTVTEAALERTHAGWRWVRRRVARKLPSSPIPGGAPIQ